VLQVFERILVVARLKPVSYLSRNVNLGLFEGSSEDSMEAMPRDEVEYRVPVRISFANLTEVGVYLVGVPDSLEKSKLQTRFPESSKCSSFSGICVRLRVVDCRPHSGLISDLTQRAQNSDPIGLGMVSFAC